MIFACRGISRRRLIELEPNSKQVFLDTHVYVYLSAFVLIIMACACLSCVWTSQPGVFLVQRPSFPALSSSNSGSRRSRPQAQSLWEIQKCNTIRPLRIMPAEKLAEFGTFSGKFHACLVHVHVHVCG